MWRIQKAEMTSTLRILRLKVSTVSSINQTIQMMHSGFSNGNHSQIVCDFEAIFIHFNYLKSPLIEWDYFTPTHPLEIIIFTDIEFLILPWSFDFYSFQSILMKLFYFLMKKCSDIFKLANYWENNSLWVIVIQYMEMLEILNCFASELVQISFSAFAFLGCAYHNSLLLSDKNFCVFLSFFFL